MLRRCGREVPSARQLRPRAAQEIALIEEPERDLRDREQWNDRAIAQRSTIARSHEQGGERMQSRARPPQIPVCLMF